MENRTLIQTDDGVLLVGTMERPVGATSAVLMLHMMPADRTSWRQLQAALAERGVASLAIDLRGHGESLRQDTRRLDYRTFSDADHQASREDVRASLSWLETHGFPTARVGLAGASIGANLALEAMANDHRIPAGILLSPGENYRGLAAYPAAAGLDPSQAVFVAASQGDDQESYEASREILERVPGADKKLQSYGSAGHGTNMFMPHPELVTMCADWLRDHLR